MQTVKIERDSAEWERVLEWQRSFIQWWGFLTFTLMMGSFAATFIFAYAGMATMAIVMAIACTIGTAGFAITPGWRTIADD